MISIEAQAAVGAAFLTAGWLLSRWCDRYDIRGWLMGAAWRAVWRGDGRKLIGALPAAVASKKGAADLMSVIAADETLKQVFLEMNARLAADTARYGKERATLRLLRGLLLAEVLSKISSIAKLIGVIALAVAVARWLW